MIRFEGIRKARIAAGLSMAEVAQAAGKSIGWVYAAERGLLAPSQEDAEAIARLIGKPTERLFSRLRKPDVSTEA